MCAEVVLFCCLLSLTLRFWHPIDGVTIEYGRYRASFPCFYIFTSTKEQQTKATNVHLFAFQYIDQSTMVEVIYLDGEH